MANVRSFDLNLLPVLEALLSEGKVTAAAHRLNLSQPATSAALARLRAAFDDPLLVRSGRAMALSHLGEELRPRIGRLLGDIEALINPRIAFDPNTTRRRFRIAASDYAANVVLAPLSGVLQAEAPGASLEILPFNDRFAERLAAGDYDIAISDGWSLRSAFRSETLFRERYACIARAGHPRIGEELTLETFLSESHVLIAPTADVKGPIDVALARIGARRRVAVTVPHFLAAPAIIAASDLVMTIAWRIASSAAKQHRLRIFEPPVTVAGFAVAMAWPAEREGDPAIDWLKQRLRALHPGKASAAHDPADAVRPRTGRPSRTSSRR